MNCDKCAVELVPVFDNNHMRRRGDFPQYQDALVVDLVGGYGMLIDDFDMEIPGILSANRRRVLCKHCGKALLEYLGAS
jgi:RNase P subunit RPR2